MPWYSPESPRTNSFKIDVDWPLSGGWVKMSDEQRQHTGIIQYRFQKNDGNWVYDYILEVETEFENYDYKFTDGEPDEYSVNAKFKGNHSVKFNSKNPTIRQVSGAISPPVEEWSN
jgi:hypothetical protein